MIMKPSKSTDPAEKPARPIRERAGRGAPQESSAKAVEKVPEIGGRKGPDPTRYGDWEKNGRCIDF